MMVRFGAIRASGNVGIIEMTGAFGTKRGNVPDDRILAARAEDFRGGTDREVFLADKAVRGINQVAQTIQKMFQHGAMVAFC